MKACKVKQMVVAALAVCAGIFSANAGEDFAYAEREISLLPPDEDFVYAEEEFELLPPADDFVWDEKEFWLMPDAQVKPQEQTDIENAFGPGVVVDPILDESGNPTNYLVTVTNDLTGPVILPESVKGLVIDLGGHSITGLVGKAGTEGTPGGDGTPAIVVSNATAQVSIIGPGTVSGGNGGAGNPPGEGAPAIADADGNPVEPAVSGDADVSSGETGKDLKPAIDAEGAKVTAIAVGDGDVTLTVEVTFKADITSDAFATWAEGKLKVKSSDVLEGLDDAEAKDPSSIGEAKCAGVTATVDLTVEEKPSEDAEFYRVVIP